MTRAIKPELQHYLASFLLQAAMMVAMTLIPFFCFQRLGGNERSAAIAYGVQTLSLGITCFFSASFVSRLRNGLVCCLIGSVGFGILYLLAGFTTTPTAFCILTGLAMTFFALAWPALQSWLGAQREGQKRARSFSYFNVAIGLGLTIGPVVEGTLYQVNLIAPFVAVLLLSSLAGVLLFTLPRENSYFGVSAATEPPDAANCAASGSIYASEMFLYCGWLANLLGWGLTGAVRTVYAAQIKDLVQRGQLVLFLAVAPGHVFTAMRGPTAATLYSGMQAALSLGYFTAILGLGRTTRWQCNAWLVVAVDAMLGAAIWTLAGSRSLFVMLLCHAAVGMVTAFGYLGSQCYSAANPRWKHRRIALQEGLSQSAGFAFPLIFAQFAASYGVGWPFRYTPAFLVFFAAVQLLSLRFARRRLCQSAPAATLRT